MALDSAAVYALQKEVKSAVCGGRIDKIYQPERDEIMLGIRTFTDSYKLLISASPSNARINFTPKSKENPKTPPMFCMLLRKHLQSGKILEVTQPDFERIIKITVQSYNELGDQVQKHLIAELTGRNSNIILTDDDGRIIDCARHVDFTQSSVRQLLPGLAYKCPPPQDKVPLLDAEKPFEIDFSLSAQTAEKAIMSAVSGISPLLAREVVYSACGDAAAKCAELSENAKRSVISSLDLLRQKLLSGEFSPALIRESGSGRIIDFSVIRIRQYAAACEYIEYGSMSELLEAFYDARDNRERMKQKSSDLLRLINTNLERLSKKLIIQQKTLHDAENKEKYKRMGDLITSAIYLIKPGDTKAVIPDYFTDGAPEVEVSLSPELTPSQNAQKYYKKYQKAKNAQIEVTKQLSATRADIDYLESTLALCENCSSVSDINALRAELAEEGYLKRKTAIRKKKTEQSKPHHFKSSDGFDIYVGKNNLQNDRLTLRFANTSDIWFHTKKIHGSHTVIKLGLDKNVPKQTMLEAAALAAYYSKARSSNQVPVDYTEIKNVKKPNGAKPGMVIYDGYNTIYTAPKSPEELGLLQCE